VADVLPSPRGRLSDLIAALTALAEAVGGAAEARTLLALLTVGQEGRSHAEIAAWRSPDTLPSLLTATALRERLGVGHSTAHRLIGHLRG
jgi:hypothetical protein